jgi:2-methylisocitrate lyase-like PEP mutase family enzyme
MKLSLGKAKRDRAIAEAGGTALYVAHILPHLTHFLPALLSTGVQMFELTAGSVYLERHPPPISLHAGGRYGMRRRAHLADAGEFIERIHQVREALGEDPFLNVGPTGVATNVGQVRFSESDALEVAAAGADGLHVHLASLSELQELVMTAHGAGMLVEAYISEYVSDTDEFSYFGIRANSPREAAEAARNMEAIGVDTIGFMFSKDPQFYSMVQATESLPEDVDERLVAIREAVSIPISVEGQITRGNAKRLRDIGVNVIVLGTHLDIAIEQALKRTIEEFSRTSSGRAVEQ